MTTVLEAADAPFRLTAPIEHITKLDDGTLLLHCTVTSETPDSQGEIVDYDAFKAAAPELMKWATLGEMHDPERSDAGTILKLYFDDVARRVEADLHVVDPVAIRKVLSRTYKAVSIGGKRLAATPVMVAGRWFHKITRMVLDELSLVNRPANPDALIAKQFILAKRATEPDMDEIDAGTTSPLGEPEPDLRDARTPEQRLIDETREALAKRDVPQSERDAMAAADFAGKDESFPIRKPEDVAAAASSIGHAGPDNYSSDELRSRITAIARRKGPAFVAQLPKAWLSKKARKSMAKLAKGNDALDAASDAIEAVGEAMAEEAKEQEHGEDESKDLETLRTADEALHDFQAAESAEPAEGMEKADAPTTPASKPTKANRLAKRVKKLRKANRRLAKANRRLTKAKRRLTKRASFPGLARTLTKAGARNNGKDAERIAKIHDLTVGLGFDKCMNKAGMTVPVEPLAKSDGQAPATEPLTLMRDALAEILPAAKVDAIQAMLVEQGERIAKIASTPTSGGPARAYAPVFRGGSDAGEIPDKGSLLAKAADAVDDPRLKEQISQAAATSMISQLRAGG